MRLIGTFDTEQEAYNFYSFLLKQGIQNIYESYSDPQDNSKRYRIWTYNEDDFQTALDFLNQYKAHPDDPQFKNGETSLTPIPPSPQYTDVANQEDLKWQTTPPRRVRVQWVPLSLTNVLLFICVSLFFWNSFQQEALKREKGSLAHYFAHTPLERFLLFDYPRSFREMDALIQECPLKSVQKLDELPLPMKEALKKAQNVPTWKGLFSYLASNNSTKNAISVFTDIRQGQIWRLFTPSLLHYDFLHILFNMAWLWVLGRQIEERISWWKMGLLILIIGSVSNTFQYLISGPTFLGFSGVIVGMAGFIWMRQRHAPWEGYPLSRATELFLLIFVLSMAVLGFLSFVLHLFSLLDIQFVIANTAHIVGGLCGIALGYSSFFAKGRLS